MRVNLSLVGYGCTQTHTRIYPYPFHFTLSIPKNGYIPAGRCHLVNNHNLKLPEHIFFLPLLARPLPLGAANLHYCSHPSTLSSPREQGHPATVLFVTLGELSREPASPHAARPCTCAPPPTARARAPPFGAFLVSSPPLRQRLLQHAPAACSARV
jgi:hypothetical protein